MLKKRVFRKIIMTTAVLFSCFLMNVLPDNEYEYVQSLKYVSNYHEEVIYLIDQYQMVARTKIKVEEEKDVKKKAKQLIEMLIKEGEGEAKLPSGFKNMIPSDTKIIGIDYKDSVLKN